VLERTSDAVLVPDIATAAENCLMRKWPYVLLCCGHDAVCNSGLLVRPMLLLEPLSIADIV